MPKIYLAGDVSRAHDLQLGRMVARSGGTYRRLYSYDRERRKRVRSWIGLREGISNAVAERYVVGKDGSVVPVGRSSRKP